MDKPFPAYKGAGPYVFVCYSHTDAQSVYSLLKRLYDDGFNFWYDEGISFGQEWTQEIADAIGASSKVIYFVSNASTNSRHCRNEIQYALEQDKDVYCIYLEPTELPGGLQLSLGLTQAIHQTEIGIKASEEKLKEVLSNQYTDPGDVSQTNYTKARKTQSLEVEQLSIAVLPVRNLSNDPNLELVVEGIMDSLMGQLTELKGLRVIARTSTLTFSNLDRDLSNAATTLGVEYLVDASVQSDKDNLRLTLALVSETGTSTIWSQSFNGNVDELFLLQDSASSALLNTLIERNPSLKGREYVAERMGRHIRGTENISAYQAYLQGKSALALRKNASVLLALEHFQSAIDIDRTYAKAWGGLAAANLTVAVWGLGNRPRHMAIARSAASTAIGYDPSLPLPYITLANVQGRYEWNFAKAENSLQTAVELAPDSADALAEYGNMLAKAGKTTLAIEMLERAWLLDPLNVEVARSLILRYTHADRLEEASSSLHNFLELSPTNGDRHWLMSLVAIAEQDYEAALTHIARDDLNHLRLSISAIALHKLGKPRESEQMLGQLIESDGDAAAFQVAEVYAQRGDAKNAMEWLETAYKNRDSGVAELLSSSSFRPIYGTSQFREYAQKLKLKIPM